MYGHESSSFIKVNCHEHRKRCIFDDESLPRFLFVVTKKLTKANLSSLPPAEGPPWLQKQPAHFLSPTSGIFSCCEACVSSASRPQSWLLILHGFHRLSEIRCNRTRQRPGSDNDHTIWSLCGPEISGPGNDQLGPHNNWSLCGPRHIFRTRQRPIEVVVTQS